MQFGVFTFATDFSMDVVELARAAEDHGFESLWLGEHSHIPTSRVSPWAGGRELPRDYYHMLDPFVALTAAAAVTTRLKVGTAVTLVVERDPIWLAKEVASLDHVSKGRFLFGVGGGWNREEMQNHGTRPSLRWKILRERVLAMKQIWARDEAEFHGEFVKFDPIWAWPKPVQQPHPPILIGGDGPRTLARVVDFGDEWMPIGRSTERLKGRIAELNELAAQAGRGPIPVSIWGARMDADAVEELRAIGVSRCIFVLPTAGAGEIMPVLARGAEVARRFATA